MSRRKSNELFIGTENMTLEGGAVKHPSLVKYFANLNVNKISSTPMEFIGVDLETNHLTAELKLLGFYENKEYRSYTQNFLGVLFNKVKECYWNKKRLVWWNRLDPFVLYKQFLLLFPEEERYKSLARYQKISGEYNKEGFWELPPVVEVKIGTYFFGISNAIRSSIQFYFYNEFEPDKMRRVWAYDIANLFSGGLEQEAERLGYYSKVDKSAHLVDWVRYKEDEDYKRLVLKSNYLDSRAVHDLAVISIENFYKIFNFYPRTLISAGSLARAGIVASITNLNGTDEEKTLEDLKSIALVNYFDEWKTNLGSKHFNSLISLFNEAYSGGYIESIAYGSVKEAWTVDIASAYPSIAVKLWDLRGAVITYGNGKIPRKPYSYCFLRGDIRVPADIDYHPITIKHPTMKTTNIRASGEYRASYTLSERDYLISLGATFKNEEWFNIETKGILSPLAYATNEFLEARTRLLAIGDSAQYTAKTCANSVYGILYEAIDTYEFNEDNTIQKAGYRAGEFNNPLYASIITSEVRILISKGANAIKDNGGQPIVIMTDSIFWKGRADMLPQKFWTEKKTLGYFEKPELVTDMVCLGAGRYEFKNDKGKFRAKKRGLNITDLLDDEGITLNEFNWASIIDTAIKNNREINKVRVRLLVSVGLILHQGKYNTLDLGLVKEEDREVGLIVGGAKRVIPDYEIKDLKNGLVVSKPLLLMYSDQTLPKLRNLMMNNIWLTSEEKTIMVQAKSSKKYHKKNRDKIRFDYQDKYKLLRDVDVPVKIAREIAKQSMTNVEAYLKNC